jgi:hypothetical protein
MNIFDKLYDEFFKSINESINEAFNPKNREVSLSFFNDDEEDLYDFLIKSIKSRNGFLGEELDIFKSLLDKQKNNPSKKDEFYKKSTISFNSVVTYTVPVGSGSTIRQGRRTTTFFFNKEKSRIVKATKQNPSNKKIKIIFEADPNYLPLDLKTVKDQHETGSNIEIKLKLVQVGMTKYQKEYYKFVDHKNVEYISFKKLPNNAELGYDDIILASVEILKKDVFNNKINYVISIKKISNIDHPTLPTTINKIANDPDSNYNSMIIKAIKLIKDIFPEYDDHHDMVEKLSKKVEGDTTNSNTEGIKSIIQTLESPSIRSIPDDVKKPFLTTIINSI